MPQRMIDVQELDKFLQEIQVRPADWQEKVYDSHFTGFRQPGMMHNFLKEACEHIAASVRANQDYSIAIMLVAATMVEAGYALGRARAEAEVLDGWMKL